MFGFDGLVATKKHLRHQSRVLTLIAGTPAACTSGLCNGTSTNEALHMRIRCEAAQQTNHNCTAHNSVTTCTERSMSLSTYTPAHFNIMLAAYNSMYTLFLCYEFSILQSPSLPTAVRLLGILVIPIIRQHRSECRIYR